MDRAYEPDGTLVSRESSDGAVVYEIHLGPYTSADQSPLVQQVW